MPRRTILIISISQIISYIAPLITFPILIKAFDISTYGIWIETSTIVSLAVSFGIAGLSNALSMLVVNNKDDHDPIYINGLYVFLTVGIGLGLIIWAFSPGLNNITMRNPSGTTILRIASSIPLISSIQILCIQIFRLRQQPLVGASLEIVLVIARLMATITASITHDLVFFAIAYSILQAITVIPFLMFAYRGYRLTSPSWRIIKTTVVQSANLSLVSQSLWLVQYGDRFMISILSVSAAVAIYSASYQICLILIALGWPYLYALLPILGNHWKSGNLQGMQDSVRQSSRSMAILLIPAIVGLTACSDTILRLLATKDFSQGSLLIGMITLAIGLDTIGGNMLYIFFAQGRTNITRAIYLRAAILNIVANMIAIPLYSYQGAGFVTLITFTYIFYSLWRKTEMPFRALFDLSAIFRCILASCIMGIWVVGIITVNANLTGLVSAISGGIIIYGIAIIMLKIISINELLAVPTSILNRIR